MIELNPLSSDDREQFITDNQEAFIYGALEEFGRRAFMKQPYYAGYSS